MDSKYISSLFLIAILGKKSSEGRITLLSLLLKFVNVFLSVTLPGIFLLLLMLVLVGFFYHFYHPNEDLGIIHE